MRRRNPTKFLLLFLTISLGMRRSFLSSLSLLNKGRRRTRRRRRRRRRRREGVKGERKQYFPLSMLLLL
jgi:hypothetical protein